MNKSFFSGILVAVVAGCAVAVGCSDADGGGPAGAGCGYGGKTHAIGESYLVDCNECFCTANGPTCTAKGCDAGSDAGSDTPIDAPPVDANDFGSFAYNWYGTGVSESFMLDHDCGVATTSTTSGTPPKSGTGTVAASDCEAFEKLVTSPAVVTALSDKAPKCTDGTDDMGSYTLRLLSGGTIGRSASGCSGTEPFATVKSEMHRIGGKYATSTTDAGTDADAHD